MPGSTLDTIQDGLIRVLRDGELVSEHQREDKAISSGYRAKAGAPASVVRIVRPDLRVEGRMDCPDAPAEEPTEPEPEPEPTPEPEPAPEGFVTIFETDGSFGTLEEMRALGWNVQDQWGERVRVIPDPTNPTGSGKSLEFTHPVVTTGQGSGRAKITSFGVLDPALGPMEEVRLTMWIHRNGWKPEHGGKFWYLGLEPTAHIVPKIQSNVWYTSWQLSGGFKITRQALKPENQNQYVDGVLVGLDNEWVKIEVQHIASSAPGVADGISRIRLNGMPVHEKTDWRTWEGPDADGKIATGRLLDGFEWYHNISNHLESAEHRYRIGHFSIQGRAAG